MSTDYHHAEDMLAVCCAPTGWGWSYFLRPRFFRPRPTSFTGVS